MERHRGASVKIRTCDTDGGVDRAIAVASSKVLEKVVRVHLKVPKANSAGKVWVEKSADRRRPFRRCVRHDPAPHCARRVSSG